MKIYNYKFKCPLCGCTKLAQYTTGITEFRAIYGIEKSAYGCHHGVAKNNYDDLCFDDIEVRYYCYNPSCDYSDDFDTMIEKGYLELTTILEY